MILLHHCMSNSVLSEAIFRSGWSPLLLAASNGHLELVKIFLDVNARVDVFDQVKWVRGKLKSF